MDLKAIAGPFRDAEQFDRGIKPFAPHPEVDRLDSGNALAINVLHMDPAASRDRSQNRNLMGRVDALHVKGGIGLGKTRLFAVLDAVSKSSPSSIRVRM